MKKFIMVSFFALALFCAKATFASASFNTEYNDLPTVQVSNYTQHPGCSTCWAPTVSANPGDVVAVEVYYHNTSPTVASSTHIYMSPQTTGAVSSQTFSGSVGGVSGSAVVSLSSSVTLNYISGSTVWYADQNMSSPAGLLNGQNGSELFSGGLNIGDIGGENSCPNSNIFCHQGIVIAHFQAGNVQQQAQCTINSFTANPSNITAGNITSLQWSTTNCLNVNLSGFGNVAPSGNQQTGALYNSNSYTLSATGNNGNPSQTVYVTVNQQQQNPCVINSFSASPTSVTSGGSTILNWSTSNCTSASISGIGSVAVTGSQSTGAIYGTMNYTLSAYGTNGNPSQTITVTSQQQQNNCFINSFSANPTSVANGGYSTLSWSTSGCTSVSISNIGSVSNSSSQSIGPVYGTMTYTLSAYGNSNGVVTQTVSVFASQQQQNNCYINSFYASPTSVSSGLPVTLNWSTNYGGNGTLTSTNGYYSSVSSTGSQTFYPTATTTYTLNMNCSNYNSYNSSPASQSITVTVNPVYVAPVTATVSTLLANGITQTSARLNGLVINNQGTSVTAHFEYGTTTSYGYVTSNQSIGSASSISFADTASNLTPATSYFFRAVAQTGNGTVYGDPVFFRTLSNSVPTPVIVRYVNTYTGGGPESLLSLTVTTPFSTVYAGDSVNDVITYTNISSQNLTNAILRVELPKDFTFVNSSAGSYSSSDNAVILQLGTLVPKQTGTVTVQSRVSGNAKDKDALVTAANVAFTDRNTAQQDALAYAIHNFSTGTNGNNQAAAAFMAGFLPTTLLGWLILIIIILVLIYFGRRVYGTTTTSSRTTTTHTPPPSH